jgi:alkylation response protein AidB-like acyl-CoA dehydrogenase
MVDFARCRPAPAFAFVVRGTTKGLNVGTDTIDTLGRTADNRHSHETPAMVLEAVRAMVPAIAGRGDEIEAARRLPPDLVSELTAAGCFRLVVPAHYGASRPMSPPHAT